MDENVTCKKLETVGEVAPMLKMSEQALYEAARKGLVPVVRIGRRIRFDLDAIERWLESGGSPWGDSGSGYVNRWSN
jgi:excisionase family DNA binding protein